MVRVSTELLKISWVGSDAKDSLVHLVTSFLDLKTFDCKYVRKCVKRVKAHIAVEIAVSEIPTVP